MVDIDWDDVALEGFEAQTKQWVNLLHESSDGLHDLICPIRGNNMMKVVMATGGSFNCGIRLRFDDGKPDWFVRFPMPGHSMFLDEKTRNEVAVMKYIEEHRKIPVPHIIAYGMSDEDSTGLGPFIIMNWVDGKKMSEILTGSTSEERGTKLNHEIDTTLLKTLYGRMADILLELWDHEFDAIGCLDMDHASTPATWTVKHRPLTLEMNELVRCMGISEKSFPKATDPTLSARMRKSIEEETFWFAHAVRKTINMDSLYWSALDVYCYGPRTSIAERVYRSTTLPLKHRNREAFVRRKINDLQAYHLERGEEPVEYEVEEYIATVSQLI